MEVEMSKKRTPLWREAHLEVKMHKAPHVRAAYGRPDVVLMSKKSARRCGPKHIYKSNVSKAGGFGQFPTFRCRFVDRYMDIEIDS